MDRRRLIEDEDIDLTDDERKDNADGADTPSSVKDLKKNSPSVNSPMKVQPPIDHSKSSKTDDIPSKTDIPSKGNPPNRTPNITPNDVMKMVKKEVDRAKKELDRGNKPSANQQPSHQSTDLSALTPKSKKKSATPSKTQKGKTTPPTKQNLPTTLIYGSYDHLEVVNISKELVYRLPYFSSQKITDYSTQMDCNYGIISVCDGSRDVNTNMNYTLSLITDFINYDYTYIPIYLKSESNEIEDIIFVVFQFRSSNTDNTAKQRTYYDLQQFLMFCSQKYSVREYYLKQNNQFISVSSKGNLLMKTNRDRDVIISSLKQRNIIIKEKSYLHFNTQPTNIAEQYERTYSRNEICI